MKRRQFQLSSLTGWGMKFYHRDEVLPPLEVRDKSCLTVYQCGPSLAANLGFMTRRDIAAVMDMYQAKSLFVRSDIRS